MPDPGHWPEVARQWALLGPPLKPSKQDTAFAATVLSHWQARPGRPPRALILGVTPELHALPWPEQTHLLALDHTQAMIDAVWPGAREEAICGDWTRMPLLPQSFDFALCDGGLILLNQASVHEAFVHSLARVLTPGGVFVLRAFVPPAEPESLADIASALQRREMPSVNHLKMRLLMALQRTPEAGVRLGDVWQALQDLAPSLPLLAQQQDWLLAEIELVRSYEGRDTRYHFLPLEQVQRLFCEWPGGFEGVSVHYPTYMLGERCPTMVFRRR